MLAMKDTTAVPKNKRCDEQLNKISLLINYFEYSKLLL